jgi:CubicO group peptidase (beta-lactamase class C family)
MRSVRTVRLLLLLLLVACSTATTSQTSAPVYPVPEWQRIEPAAAGFDAAKLPPLRAKLDSIGTTAMMVVVNGRSVFEYGDITRISYHASVRKSLLSMLIGIYKERGQVDLNKTLEQLGIDDVGGLTKEERQATVLNLLTARSGVYHAASNAGDDLASAPPRGSQKPGTYMLYSNWDFNALGTAFEKMTGMSIYDAFEQSIAKPIGMQEWDRSRHRRGGNAQLSEHLAYHFHLSTRDMARVGYLMLREGNWNGRQIVPKAWVKESTATFTPRMEMNPESHRRGIFSYGYLWWVFDNPERLPKELEGAYTGLGAVGQMIMVVPKLNMVIAHKTDPATEKDVSATEFMQAVMLLLKARAGS